MAGCGTSWARRVPVRSATTTAPLPRTRTSRITRRPMTTTRTVIRTPPRPMPPLPVDDLLYLGWVVCHKHANEHTEATRRLPSPAPPLVQKRGVLHSLELLTVLLIVSLTAPSHNTPRCTPARPARASSRCIPSSAVPSSTPPSPRASRTCTSPPPPPHTSPRTGPRDTRAHTHAGSSSTASHTPSHTRTALRHRRTSHSLTSSRSSTVSSQPAGRAGTGRRGNTPTDTGGGTCVGPRRGDDILRMACRNRDMAKNNAIRLGRHSFISHASHTPIIGHISHHKKRDCFCHSKTPPPSYALLRTPSPPFHDTAGTVRLRGKSLCIRVHRGVSTRREGYKEDTRRDDRNGPEFWHDDNDWVFDTNRGISGRRTVETPCTERTPSSCHTRTSPPPA